MGKRAEKNTRAAAKEKRAAASSPKAVTPQLNPIKSSDVRVSVVKERKQCPHLPRGIDLDKFSAKIKASDPSRCEDCREGSSDRRGKKGKGKHGKKKGSALVDSKAIWVCLDCGHYACGGVGLPTTPQSHVVRHARQTRHPLVIQWDNPHLRWCFPCNTLIPVEKTDENGEKKDVWLEVVKLIKGRTAEGSMVDVEDVWFGAGSITREMKSESIVSSGNGLDAKAGYVVRGLTNLGNTCFFNSVMQNLLAMDRVRDYFLNMDASFGPLTIALKELIAETKPETCMKDVINPRSFFGCLCSKAPQFRGYDQHDSHELLRCLLDGLSTEELKARKKINASMENEVSSNQGPTLVDSVFGGQISSAVCCVECGYSSTVYEPFLDLSLPVPTKKPPPKKTQPAKKAKLSPKKTGKSRPKINKSPDAVTAQSISNPSAGSESPCFAEAAVPLNEKMASFSGNSSQLCSVVPATMASQSCSASQNGSAVPQSESEEVLENLVDASLDVMAWLEYVEPESISDEHNMSLQSNDVLFQDSREKYKVSDDILMELDEESNKKMDASSVNSWEDELPVLAQDSEVILLPYHEESPNTMDLMSREPEISSSLVGYGYGQEEQDFDGFGELFNEPEPVPEIAAGPFFGPSLPNEGAVSGSVVGNSSESDPDEVDDSDSPVSIEGCLAHFIKTELLTNDNAWDCEGCARTLQRQVLEALRKQTKLALKTLVNGGERGNQSDLQITKEISSLSEVKNPSNGDMDINLNSVTGSLVSHNRIADYLNQNSSQVDTGQTCETNTVVSQQEERKVEMNGALEEQCQFSGSHKSCSRDSSPDQADDSCSIDESSSFANAADKVQQSGRSHASKESNDKEIKSKTVKVKRDATKRVLIDKAPPILTIHLKRFSQDARGRLSKLNGHVNFRETIDLRPYMNPRCIEEEKYVYHLVGVVEHSGTMRGGHYVAYVKGTKSKGKAKKESGDCAWHHVSDAYVREVSPEQVFRCEAYILFYQKI